MIAIVSRISVLISVAAILAGCAGRTPDVYSYAYSDRHSIANPRVERIDVGANPTPQDTVRVARFGYEFTRTGTGKIVIFVPQTGAGSLSSGQWVKQELIASGVAARHIQWDARPMPTGTVRVAFSKIRSGETSPCTNLFEDLQQFENQTSYLNRETANFGCAYHATMLAQADNPNDFMRPRIESPIDPIRAANAVRERRTVSSSTPPATADTP